MPPKKPDTLELVDRILQAAIKEVRRARALAPGAAPDAKPIGKRTSNTETCRDILIAEGRPMHAAALVAALEKRKIRTSRDSIVSALSKRLAPRGPFVRTAGNTFGLAGRDTPGEL